MKRLILALAALSISGAVNANSFALARVSQYAYVPSSLSACGVTHPGQIALSRDLFRKAGGCGATIRVWFAHGGHQDFVLRDKMNARYLNSADILVSSRAQAIRVGITTGTLEVLGAKSNQAGRNARR